MPGIRSGFCILVITVIRADNQIKTGLPSIFSRLWTDICTLNIRPFFKLIKCLQRSKNYWLQPEKIITLQGWQLWLHFRWFNFTTKPKFIKIMVQGLATGFYSWAKSFLNSKFDRTLVDVNNPWNSRWHYDFTASDWNQIYLRFVFYKTIGYQRLSWHSIQVSEYHDWSSLSVLRVEVFL